MGTLYVRVCVCVWLRWEVRRPTKLCLTLDGCRSPHRDAASSLKLTRVKATLHWFVARLTPRLAGMLTRTSKAFDSVRWVSRHVPSAISALWRRPVDSSNWQLVDHRNNVVCVSCLVNIIVYIPLCWRPDNAASVHNLLLAYHQLRYVCSCVCVCQYTGLIRDNTVNIQLYNIQV